MSQNPGYPRAAVSLPGGNGEIALLTAIDAALDTSPERLPGRVALVRRYLDAALDAEPGIRRATFKVIAHLIVREMTGEEAERQSPTAGPVA
jgi:hypothetical protein